MYVRAPMMLAALSDEATISFILSDPILIAIIAPFFAPFVNSLIINFFCTTLSAGEVSIIMSTVARDDVDAEQVASPIGIIEDLLRSEKSFSSCLNAD